MKSGSSKEGNRFEHWSPRVAYREAVRAVRQRQEKLGFQYLPHGQQQFLAVAEFDGEVCNGGLAQYFTNPAGKNYGVVLEGFKNRRMHQQRLITERWLQLLPANVQPTDAASVGAWIFSDPPRLAKSQALDAEYYRLKDDFVEQMVRWAEEEGAV